MGTRSLSSVIGVAHTPYRPCSTIERERETEDFQFTIFHLFFFYFYTKESFICTVISVLFSDSRFEISSIWCLFHDVQFLLVRVIVVPDQKLSSDVFFIMHFGISRTSSIRYAMPVQCSEDRALLLCIL